MRRTPRPWRRPQAGCAPARLPGPCAPSQSASGRVEAGDWIGLSRAGIESVADTLSEATCGLLAKLVGDGAEIVTLIEGAGATAADTRRITEWLREHWPDASLELHHGGQPLYSYLVSVE